MKTVFAQTFPSGSIKTKVQSVTLVNNTAKTQDISVPTDTEWCIESIKMANGDNVDRNGTILLYQTSSKTNLIAYILFATITAGAQIMIPNNDDLGSAMANNKQQWILGAGETLSFIWAAGGASAGATDADAIVIKYRELPLT